MPCYLHTVTPGHGPQASPPTGVARGPGAPTGGPQWLRASAASPRRAGPDRRPAVTPRVRGLSENRFAACSCRLPCPPVSILSPGRAARAGIRLADGGQRGGGELSVNVGNGLERAPDDV